MNPIGVIIVGGAIIAVGTPILILLVVWFEEGIKDYGIVTTMAASVLLAYPVVYTIVAIKYIRWWLWDPYDWPWSKVGGVLTIIGIGSTILLYIITVKIEQIVDRLCSKSDKY